MKLKYFNLGYSINIRYRVFNGPMKTNFIEKNKQFNWLSKVVTSLISLIKVQPKL
jgi:hypothetical protein